MGFHHEQTRPDRDTHVKINVENIQSGQEYNFEKYDWKLINDFGVKYDYWSVMHYGAYVSNYDESSILVIEKEITGLKDSYNLFITITQIAMATII